MSGILSERIEMKLTIEQERQITAQYQYIKELATLKYDAEEKREQNLIQQSSQMQTAFSFMTAAVFAATAICIEYRGKLTLNFFLIAVSIVTFLLIVSLLLASIAQWRWKTEAFPDIQDIKDTVVNDPEWEKLTIKYHQINQWIDMVGKVQKKKAEINDRRVKLIMASMICFYLSIGSIVISFFIGVMKLR
jgi:hypothetical protein